MKTETEKMLSRIQKLTEDDLKLDEHIYRHIVEMRNLMDLQFKLNLLKESKETGLISADDYKEYLQAVMKATYGDVKEKEATNGGDT